MIHLLPIGWFSDLRNSSVWITCYKVMGVPFDTFAIFDLSVCMVRGIINSGALSYLDFRGAGVEMISEGAWEMGLTEIREGSTSQAPHLILLAPYDVDGQPGNEPLTRERISTATGLLSIFGGRNLVYERIFDNTINLRDGSSGGFGPVLVNPLAIPAPDVVPSLTNAISQSDATLSSFPEAQRNRAFLSLRWFEEALYNSGVDAFLKYWIALETLAMPNTTNIRPLEQALARVYAMTEAQVRDRFRVGRLFGLRSRIVHDGARVAIAANVLDYVGAIYADVVLESFGLPCENRAENLLSQDTALDQQIGSI